RTLQSLGPPPYAGISKISVQTGTSHGGVVLPDGSIARVQLDLEALRALSAAARATYRLGGAVQHGASTLPPDAFSHFPKCEAIEIHLATNFQNTVFDHPRLPAEFRRELNDWVKGECKDEWKTGDTEEQFIYKSRKRAIGPFKRRLWDLPADVRDAIGADLEKTFAFLFEQLRVTGTRAATDRYVKPPLQSHAQPRPVAVAAPGRGRGTAPRRRTSPPREGRRRLASVADRHRPPHRRGGLRGQHPLPRERPVVRSPPHHHPVRRGAARRRRLPRPASDHDAPGAAARAAVALPPDGARRRHR